MMKSGEGLTVTCRDLTDSSLDALKDTARLSSGLLSWSWMFLRLKSKPAGKVDGTSKLAQGIDSLCILQPEFNQW